MSRYREAMTHNGGGCEVLLRNNNMEVGRLSRRPLQPARPIRRTIPDRGRITYSRDVLMQISNLSVSKTKPKYLPDLPIIVQDPVLYKAGSQQAAPSGLHGPQGTPSGLHGPQVTLSGQHGAPSCAQWSIRRPMVCTFRGWLTEGAAWDPSRSEVLYKAGSQQAAPSGLHGPQVTPSGLHGAQVTPSGLHGPQVTPSGLHGPQVTLSGLHGAPSCAQWSIRRPTVCTFRGWLTEGAAWDPSRSEVSSLHHATDPSVSAHLENTHRSTRL
ncbi:uncharacterized protein C8orf88 homolog isoform X3 [Ranitomeya variabilis]|uniref:uncharacterized protein C8orf88 homolog isoform X3 n=2 Tax=Ranitomeya variabilis TaxID=490064 RepID=UPI004056E1BF